MPVTVTYDQNSGMIVEQGMLVLTLQNLNKRWWDPNLTERHDNHSSSYITIMSEAKLDQAASMERDSPSGLSIIIVGGGIAGLSFAIEAYRKGHQVSVLERRPDFNDYGTPRTLGAEANMAILTDC